MLSKSDSPKYIAEEFGRRLKRLRLNKNLRQIDVDEHSGLSRKIIINAESGNVTLENLIQILYSLNALDHLNSFLPEPPLSPIQLLKLKGKVRRKASKSTAMKKVDEKDLGW